MYGGMYLGFYLVCSKCRQYTDVFGVHGFNSTNAEGFLWAHKGHEIVYGAEQELVTKKKLKNRYKQMQYTCVGYMRFSASIVGQYCKKTKKTEVSS